MGAGLPLQLQRGRRMNAAESHRLLGHAHDLELASTGPPHERGGKARLLDQCLRRHCFFPLLEGERRSRLGLAYQRADGASRVIVSPSHAEAFVQELAEWLSGTRREVSTTDLSRPRPRRVSSPPVGGNGTARFGAIETRSPSFAGILEQVAQVAGSDLSILLLGESGTGKEHLARAIHAASPRARGPFVAVNCSALADNLIESELFGHKKGAFTGAHAERLGAFVAANGGTLLLDEIGDAPVRVQLALLRALEAKTVRAVGSDRDQPVDVRVLGATSRDLQALIAQQTFRQDLYYRLAELIFELPPLRERREDIPALAEQILTALGESVTVSRQAQAALVQYAWPGNVRELRNVLKRAVALSRGTGVLQTVHFAPLGDGETNGDDSGGDFSGDAMRERDEATTSVSGASPFPVHVERRADEIWRDQVLPEDGPGNRHDQRALNRAALLCLAARAPMTAWPTALTREWHRLFGERWATSEEGRGFRAVLRQLGLDPKSDLDGTRVLSAVAEGSRR